MTACVVHVCKTRKRSALGTSRIHSHVVASVVVVGVNESLPAG